MSRQRRAVDNGPRDREDDWVDMQGCESLADVEIMQILLEAGVEI